MKKGHEIRENRVLRKEMKRDIRRRIKRRCGVDEKESGHEGKGLKKVSEDGGRGMTSRVCRRSK